LARRVRLHVLGMTNRAKSSHVGSSFSMVELLVALYGEILRVNPEQPDWPGRDRFVLSKGHACAALYAVLAERGFFPLQWLQNFYLDGGHLPGHATAGVPGVEVSTGALGHGLSIACGMALAQKRDGSPVRVFALLSDGECDEGSTWEGVMFAAHHLLDNLVVIVDYNKVQSLGATKDVLDLDPFADKWRAFGWEVREIDGHDFAQIEAALAGLPAKPERPTCVIAHTIKGKGVSFMENTVLWHYRSPAGEELQAAIRELEAGA
jgi:transketolase